MRIVSVGIPIEKLLADPTNEDFQRFSIEFCGGTHLANTGQILHIALTHEEAVAKGVRRLVMLTGQAALDANELGAQLKARAHKASQFDSNALADEVQAILSELENRTIGLMCAHEIRQLIEKLRDKIKAAQKEYAKSGREDAVHAAREIAESASGDVIVGEIPAGGDIALTHEEAVAKGVRRLVMLTGQAALDANELGAQLKARAHKASQFDSNALADEVQAILSELENRTIGLMCAHEIRQLIEKLRDKIKAAQKEYAKSGREDAVHAAREIAESASGDVIVGEIPAGGDRQALLAAMDCVRARHENAAILLASVDADAGKVAIVASCSKKVVAKGLKAGDWVREVSAILGGKGGGRPDSAQGGGSEPAKLNDAFSRAKEFAQEKLI